MKAAVTLFLAALLAAGCVSEYRGNPRAREERSVFWRVGRTRARDVVARWGNPDYVVGDTWVWWNTDSLGGKVRAAYMHVGVTVSNRRQGMTEHRLTFGEDGRLKSAVSTQTLPGGPKWSISPF